MPAKCSAITRAGSPCPSPPLAGSQWCWTHAPEAEEARREASRKGGKSRSAAEQARKRIPPAMPPDEFAGLLAFLFRGFVAGRISPKVGTAAATIARAMLEVRQQVDVEQRLSALEAQAGIAERNRA